jgi:hypothetical protein
MKKLYLSLRGLWMVWVLVTVSVAVPARAADTLNWNTNRNVVTADIKSTGLLRVLEGVASVTGWKVFLEPETIHTVSAKFKNLPPGEALHLLLGDVNFALIPNSGESTKLYVFHTSQQNATMLVHPVKPGEEAAKARRIPNELLVTLKPGAKIDELARLLGAKVIGHIPNSNAYRLQFDSEDAANAARSQLAASPDVTSVNDNYVIDRPPDARGAASASGAPPQLQLKPPPDNGRIIVGMIDTAFQTLGNNLDSFMLKPISVAGQAQPSPDDPTHATAMAETILRGLAEETKGSTSVQILPVDVYGPNATTSTFDVANGVVQAVNGGATVLNLSLGSDSDSPFLRDLIQTVIKKGITVFAAAGNQPVTTPFYPAAYSDIGVIAVTATDGGQLAPYANRGSFVNVAAPGTSVIFFNGQEYYAEGTSSATALVTGRYSGYKDANHVSASQAQSFIISTMGIKTGSGH